MTVWSSALQIPPSHCKGVIYCIEEDILKVACLGTCKPHSGTQTAGLPLSLLWRFVSPTWTQDAKVVAPACCELGGRWLCSEAALEVSIAGIAGRDGQGS